MFRASVLILPLLGILLGQASFATEWVASDPRALARQTHELLLDRDDAGEEFREAVAERDELRQGEAARRLIFAQVGLERIWKIVSAEPVPQWNFGTRIVTGLGATIFGMGLVGVYNGLSAIMLDQPAGLSTPGAFGALLVGGYLGASRIFRAYSHKMVWQMFCEEYLRELAHLGVSTVEPIHDFHVNMSVLRNFLFPRELIPEMSCSQIAKAGTGSSNAK